MKQWFLNWLERHGRKNVIMDRISNEPYLERYYVFLKDRKWFPFNVFLHRFLKSDIDDVHDHPWSYATLILKGGYWEWQPVFNNKGQKIGEVSKWHGAGSFRWNKATSYHRIELDPEVECWTLFMPGPQKREWGFLIGNFWVQWQDYLEKKATHAGNTKS